MIHLLWCTIRPETFTHKICNYRNCNKDISNMRPDAKFCCRNHKTYENTYKKREKNKKGNTDL